MKERIKTYVMDLDEQIGGGVPKGHVVLVSGMPGTMKSSVAYNVLYYNARELGTRGLYVSLEQGRDSIVEQMAGLGMAHGEVEELVNIVDLGYLRMNTDQGKMSHDWLEVFRLYVQNLRAATKYELLVVDSLPVLEILSKPDDRRVRLFELFGWLRELGITTFIISESAKRDDVVHEEDFLADGIILLRKEIVGNDVQRQIIVDKMRGAKHAMGAYSLMHDGENFRITKVING
ncbi:MAG: ATPase domain-containing protein [Methanobacteriota archaeon]